jgi:hypothetical protein
VLIAGCKKRDGSSSSAPNPPAANAAESAAAASAAAAFARAYRDGDAAAATTMSVGDEASARALEDGIRLAAATRRLERAAEARYGKGEIVSNPVPSPLHAASTRPPRQGGPADWVLAASEQGRVKVTGETADVLDEDGRLLLVLRKVGGAWKADRTGLTARAGSGRVLGTAREMGSAYEETAAEIEAGRHPTADEARQVVQARLNAVVMKNLLAPPPAATGPAAAPQSQPTQPSP